MTNSFHQSLIMVVRYVFFKSSSVERVHLQFLKRFLGVKRNTKNDFIYG